MKEIVDKCAVCGKEIIIKDKDMITKLQNIKCKNTCAKLYCSEECKNKIRHQIEGCLDVNDLFS